MKISTIHSLSKEDCEKLLVDLESKNMDKKSKLIILQLRYQDRRATNDSIADEISEVVEEIKSLEREAKKPPDERTNRDLQIHLLSYKLKHQQLLRKLEFSAGSAMVMKEYEMLLLQTEIDTVDDFIEMIKKQWRVLDQN